ncbi:hypothetical protein BCR36DRAFT_584805 [Piromyces finnis]|uniref:PIPK domain-containing protein n=1 Tax=Piromyces finnis TaxID=1754191 RepID=A0A1Y1V4P0_9FUNG|nr:hypothetical protein BCR36DRAFT_584805 [Piromyces finnis]|eukprot:ORX47297.1 hypothetical protein BCR36DRAFT_584805 [Piromyces finnis]
MSSELPNHLILAETAVQQPQNQNDNIKKSDSVKRNNSIKHSVTSISIRKNHSIKRQSKALEVLIGTPIREDHVHYILMLNMLNGIRFSVTRSCAKEMRPLVSEDFRTKHKIALDVNNNELMPSSEYYYKFKDYAPLVFRSIREICKIDTTEYLMSLTDKYVLSELGSPGKSGSFFYYSQDYRFIIKTVHHDEHKYLLKILKNYYEHIKNNPDTLICKIYGLHRVKIPYGKKIHFIVMANVFPPDKDIHVKYDLKGSKVGRFIPTEEEVNNKLAVLKDLNWLKNEKKLYLGNKKAATFINQLEKDVKFLSDNNVMDYSLLVGIHNMNKGNQENIRDTTLSIIEPNPESLSKQSAMISHRNSKAIAIVRAFAESNPVALTSSALPSDTPEERKHFVFSQDEGGYQATDENDEPLSELYFLGIIDIFTNFNLKKRCESYFKSIISDSKTVSAVNPKFYAKRFLSFIKSQIGHDENVKRLKHSNKRNPRRLTT